MKSNWHPLPQPSSAGLEQYLEDTKLELVTAVFTPQHDKLSANERTNFYLHINTIGDRRKYKINRLIIVLCLPRFFCVVSERTHKTFFAFFQYQMSKILTGRKITRQVYMREYQSWTEVTKVPPTVLTHYFPL